MWDRLTAWFTRNRCSVGLHRFEVSTSRNDLRRCTLCPRVEMYETGGAAGFGGAIWIPLDRGQAKDALCHFPPRFTAPGDA